MMKTIRCKCPICEKIVIVRCWYRKEYGNIYSFCPFCDVDFRLSDKEANNLFIKQGTKVLYDGDRVGIVDGNDMEISDKSDDINYYICPLEYSHLKVWSDHYDMIHNESVSIFKE